MRRMLSKFIVRNGEVVKSSPISDVDWQKILRLREQEVPVAAIAERFGVSYSAISIRLKTERDRTKR